jgi:hypothetical protein
VIALRLMKGGSNDLVKISGVLAGILLAAMSSSAGAQTKVKILTNHIGYEGVRSETRSGPMRSR